MYIIIIQTINRWRWLKILRLIAIKVQRAVRRGPRYPKSERIIHYRWATTNTISALITRFTIFGRTSTGGDAITDRVPRERGETENRNRVVREPGDYARERRAMLTVEEIQIVEEHLVALGREDEHGDPVEQVGERNHLGGCRLAPGGGWVAALAATSNGGFVQSECRPATDARDKYRRSSGSFARLTGPGSESDATKRRAPELQLTGEEYTE